MSVKNKLRIAQELLKQTSLLLTQETRRQTKENLKRLSQSLKAFEIQDDQNYQMQRMAVSILNDVIKVCIDKMKDYYGLDYQRLVETRLLNDVVQKTYSVEQFGKKLEKILAEDENKELIKKMNINNLLNVLQINIQQSSQGSREE